MRDYSRILEQRARKRNFIEGFILVTVIFLILFLTAFAN